MRKILIYFLLLVQGILFGQVKVLFDATKAEMAGNADWVVDADVHNVGFNRGVLNFNGNESNPQRYPTPQITNPSTATEDDWTGGISAWGIETVKLNWEVETLPINGRITYGDSSNEQDLSHYDIYVIVEPNYLFSDEEKTAILDFVYNGGSLFLISDHERSDRDGDGNDSVDVWEDFLDDNPLGYNPFGIHVNHESFTEASYEIADLPGNPVLHGNYGDVTSIEFYAGTSFSLDHTENQDVTALVFRKNSMNNYQRVMIASSSYGQGKVLAVGDSSIVDDGSGDPNDHLYDGWIEDAHGNHRRLIMNAMLWMEGDSSSIEKTSNSYFKVYVSENQLFAYFSKKNDFRNLQIYLFDLSGKRIAKINYVELPYVLPENLEKATYIYQIQSKEGIIQKGKIILK